ncbi:hypothetical protein MES4922_360120 [Mesorhizobium ventifaucium]|uniref:Uncharacterized protein n=1 Tax=Mesorhizobium ventifaucium TaxID=666020 RepID=A0ABM9E6U9_9HYPH|nr:hypothetical protein MES4922_360120 [Mesorhizobium ventifaucium]
MAPQRLRTLHRRQSLIDGFLSPEILVVVYDLFFEFREWATDCYMAPSGGEHLMTTQIEGHILRIVSG